MRVAILHIFVLRPLHYSAPENALVFGLVYLLALFLLTASSFLVFLPMRLFHLLYMVKRRITYDCPYDDCPSKAKSRQLPIHLCSCGAQYDDLMPSFYGIFHHRCRHDDGDVQLPTMDFLGRNRLTRLCPGCKRELLHSSMGDLAPHSLIVVGSATVGKTVLLRQAIRHLIKHFASYPGGKAQIDSRQQRHEFQEDLAELDKGAVLPKTAAGLPAIGLAVRVPDRLHSLLLFHDAPGEQFETMKAFARKQVMERVKGVVLLVDPFSLPRMPEAARVAVGRDLVSELTFQTTAINLIKLLQMVRPTGSTGKFDLPLAVVLSKSDALPEGEMPLLANLYSKNGQSLDPEVFSASCRKALDALGAGNVVRGLEQYFTSVRYFACSALGRIPDPKNRAPFQPAGVIEPFLWLLRLSAAEKA